MKSSFPHGFEGGVAIREVPVLNLYGANVHWVHSGASSSGRGTFKKPYTTIAQALAVAAAGDLVVCKAGHAETVSSATGMQLNVAGVSIIGLGVGARRPTLTLDTATTATIAVSAANVSLQNFVISANFADIVSAFTVTAANFNLLNCDILATAANMNFLHVIDTNTTDNSADGLTVQGCFWHEPDAATLAFALVDGTFARWNISDNVMVTGHATQDVAALFTIATGKNLTGLRVLRNQIDVTGHASSTAGVLITTDGTAGTGIIAYNNLKHLDATTEVLITATHTYGLFENRASAVANAQGYLLPAVDS